MRFGGQTQRLFGESAYIRGDLDALESWDPRAFESHLESTWLVGEIGLDRRGDQRLQEKVLDELLSITSEGPWVLSIHSSGRQGAAPLNFYGAGLCSVPRSYIGSPAVKANLRPLLKSAATSQ